jgi:RNA polymerase sigma factor (sigma-70 family)
MESSNSAPRRRTLEFEESTPEGPSASTESGAVGLATYPTNVSDEKLVQDCLSGSEEAWSTLVDKYRRLIFSIPIKFGFSRDEAAEVFQQVCCTMLSELRRLRQPRTLSAWLIKVTIHECLLATKQRARYVFLYRDSSEEARAFPDALIEEVQLQQSVREAVSKLNRRCRHLIDMLFFTSPPIPYEEVARRLGVAKGSVGFIRMRCIDGVRRVLEESTSHMHTARRREAS